VRPAPPPPTPLATPVSPAQHALCNLQNVWSYTATNSAVRCVSSFLTAHQHIVGHFSAMDASGSSQTPTGVSGSGPSHPTFSSASPVETVTEPSRSGWSIVGQSHLIVAAKSSSLVQNPPASVVHGRLADMPSRRQ